jgi:hypothetical protein
LLSKLRSLRYYFYISPNSGIVAVTYHRITLAAPPPRLSRTVHPSMDVQPPLEESLACLIHTSAGLIPEYAVQYWHACPIPRKYHDATCVQIKVVQYHGIPWKQRQRWQRRWQQCITIIVFHATSSLIIAPAPVHLVHKIKLAPVLIHTRHPFYLAYSPKITAAVKVIFLEGKISCVLIFKCCLVLILSFCTWYRSYGRGATCSSPLLTKSQNKYKNRRTPMELEIITQTDNTIVWWGPYTNT